MLVIIFIVIGYSLVFVLYAGDLMNMDSAADTFFSMDTLICLIIILIVVIYAFKYAGNPPANFRYKKIIIRTRVLLVVYVVARIVSFFNSASVLMRIIDPRDFRYVTDV